MSINMRDEPIITFRTLDDGFNFFPPVLTVDSDIGNIVLKD